MSDRRFWGKYFILTMGQLRQQGWLLAGLVLLCLLLPLGAGLAASELLSRGVDFAPVTLAVTAPEGDQVPRQLEQYMGGMEDIAQYCKIKAMGEAEGLEALRRGEVTAVLALPEDFIHGVMWGTNPDLRLIVSGDRPLESLLLLWVGQSASDILAAFQSGVYAVLDLYEEAPPPGLTRDQVVLDINLRYIRLALDRGGLFRTETISATGVLPVSLHYALALISYFALAAAPLFVPLYTGSWLTFQRRLRCAGRGTTAGCLAAAAAQTLALLLLLVPALLLTGEGGPAVLAAALGMALFCSLFASVCCLATESAAGCGTVSFLTALLALALAGGIVPPVLLPAGVRQLAPLSPVTWLMGLAAWPMGYDLPPASLAGLLLAGLGMLGAGLVLYRRRADRQGVAL
ncbi:hypothetical protein D1641_01395 [Colidextribacter sp. OB.20]|uniref:ABC transporter permease n=1 Tax=Colidextribacter sp. OB.20 TaxID=2304568 RepID=UPI00136D338D|nr:ABC transporter permease [Colidextribacter sp. OB.20]NBI08675.1 hypothetical protein [Colidextribacter sp. OB.20]